MQCLLRMKSRTGKKVNAKNLLFCKEHLTESGHLPSSFNHAQLDAPDVKPISLFKTQCVFLLMESNCLKNQKVILEKVEVCFSPLATYQSSGFLSALAMLLSGSQSCGSTLASAQQLRCSTRNTSRTALADALYCNIRLQEQTFLAWTTQWNLLENGADFLHEGNGCHI